MSIRQPFVALACLLGLSSCTTSEAPSHAAAAPLSTEAVADHIKILSSDAFEGREPGTVGEKRTLDYIVSQFKAAGLRPGWRGGWLQEVPLQKVEVTGEPSLSLGGTALAWRSQFVLAAQAPATPSVRIDGAPLVFVGYGVNAPELGWNDYAGLDMRGKVAVILVNDPDFETPQSHPTTGKFGGKAMTYYGRWTYKYEEAARQGAAAALIVHETAPAAYGWAVVESSWTGPQFSTPPAPGQPVLAAQGWISLDAANDLFRRAGTDLATLKRTAQSEGFKARPLSVAADIRFETTVSTSPSYNVIGVSRGAGAPDEAVFYGAHWDHLGRCTPDGEDDICNGAVDNATGVAALIEIARKRRADGPTRRSAIFVAFAAEEQGLLGSAYYAAHPAFPAAKTVAGFNMDGMQVHGPTRDVVVIGAGKSELEDYLAVAAASQARRVMPEDHPEAGYYYRSDHFMLAKVGIPMLYAKSGSDLLNGGKMRGEYLAADYTAKRYHKPNDEFDPNWDLRGLVQDAELYYDIGRKLSMSDAWPTWRTGSEFRVIRDASRAKR